MVVVSRFCYNKDLGFFRGGTFVFGVQVFPLLEWFPALLRVGKYILCVLYQKDDFSLRCCLYSSCIAKLEWHTNSILMVMYTEIVRNYF